MLPLEALGRALGVVPLGGTTAIAFAVVREPISPTTVLVFVRRNLGSFAATALYAQDLTSWDAISALADTESS